MTPTNVHALTIGERVELARSEENATMKSTITLIIGTVTVQAPASVMHEDGCTIARVEGLTPIIPVLLTIDTNPDRRRLSGVDNSDPV